MEALGQVGGRDALQTATQLLYDDDPMLRVSTVRALDFLPLHQRFQLLNVQIITGGDTFQSARLSFKVLFEVHQSMTV